MSEQASPTYPPKVRLAEFQAEGRTREPNVEAQVQALLALPRNLFWQRVRNGPIPGTTEAHGTTGRIAEETLVCILRHWSRSEHLQDQEHAWEIAEILVERSNGYIYQHISTWKLAPQHIEECMRDLQVQMLQDLFNESRGTEFWEIRFWLCLKRRLLNTIRHYRILTENEVNADDSQDDEGNSVNFFDKVANSTSMSPQLIAEARQALRQLPDLVCKAFLLYHYYDFSQEEIAEHFQVTDRTVRNWLTRAHQKFKEWREQPSPSA